MNIPGIPAGNVDVNVKIFLERRLERAGRCSTTPPTCSTGPIRFPGSLLPQIQSQASSRYQKKVMNSTYYVFFNTKAKPVLPASWPARPW